MKEKCILTNNPDISKSESDFYQGEIKQDFCTANLGVNNFVGICAVFGPIESDDKKMQSVIFCDKYPEKLKKEIEEKIEATHKRTMELINKLNHAS